MTQKRLLIKVNIHASDMAEGVQTVNAVNKHFGLEPIAAYHYTGTGVRFQFAGEGGDRIVQVFAEVVPRPIMDVFEASRYQGHTLRHYTSQLTSNVNWDQHSMTFECTTKTEFEEILATLNAPSNVKSALKKAKVKSWETLLDSSPESGGVFKYTIERGTTSSLDTSFTSTVDNIDIKVDVSMYKRDGAPAYRVKIEFNLYERVKQAVQAFRDAGFTLFRGEIEG